MKFYSGLFFILILSFGASAQFVNNTGISINNSAKIVTNGDWVNAVGTTMTHTGSIQTDQSFMNNGTLTAGSTGGFILNYATNLPFNSGGSSMGFFVKTGAGNVTLGNTLSIRDSLILNGGLVLFANATDTVSVRSNGIVKATSTSWVEGLVARAGVGNLAFPLGRDAMSLPIVVHKANAKKITASVVTAPPRSKGPGVQAMIGYPYAYKVDEQVATDTAAYIEINYPNTLPFVSNVIVARAYADTVWASMGARLITNSGGRVTVRSYSRRLKGLYTVAQGFPADLVTDSLALVALYNSTGGSQWTTRTNWLTGEIENWAGVTVNGQSITALNLSNNLLTGPVPDPLVDIQAMQTINLSNNSITSIPDFTSNTTITTLNVSNNRLDFSSLEPNAGITGFSYLNQADFGKAIDSLVAVNSYYEFKANAGGTNSVYTWKRNGALVANANSSTYAIPNIGRSTMGDYIAEVTNPSLPGLTLKSTLQRTRAYANIGGTLFYQTNVPATKGDVTLFRVTTEAFENMGTKAIANNGSFSFEKVVLDDYQLRGFADTLVHARALPTYYENTIFWEEADTIDVSDNLPSLDIISQVEPLPPTGIGSISGYLEEDDGTGRVKKPKRVSNAGVSARRVENTGRGKEEILTLVAYVFTDANGEFTLPNLPTGTYRLNMQYPGYPMDETSFVTIQIGTALQSQVSVAANVEEGKINVRKLIITGFAENQEYKVQVYPNPAVDYIRVGFENSTLGRNVSLIDETGKVLSTNSANDKDVSIDVRNLGYGLYFLKIHDKGKIVKTLKVIVE
jgi:hypothetical protein